MKTPLNSCRLFLLDMDGTLYLGDEVFDGAIEFVHKIHESGRKYIYLTNNSSRAGTDYVTRLNRLGFPCKKENVFTAGMATALYLKENFKDKAVFVLGTRAFKNELLSYGVKISDKEATAVCVGFDTELVYKDLETAVHFLRKGAAFIAANPDLVCPMPKGEALPDCGSICTLLSAASGRDPLYIGKPNRNMVDIISEMTGMENSRIACVGDRLYTDVAVAQNAGAVSVLVLSGETTEKMLADCEKKPDYVFSDVKEMISIF